ncbi:hypothetical protein DYH09_03395 [bacterium CPR1]|nr:hypothetical protein [bacterium CPR1]
MSFERIVTRQQNLQARHEIHQNQQLLELLTMRVDGYQPGSVALLGQLVEVLVTTPLAVERWRQLSREGQRLLEREVRGEALAGEVDFFLAAIRELLVPPEPRKEPAYRDYCPPNTPARLVRKVDDWLYRSPQPSLADLTALREQGLKLVVNLRQESEQSAEHCRELSLDYHFLSVPDQCVPQVGQVLDFLRQVQARGPALVHCWAGQGRTGVFVACYRLARGIELEEAVALSDREAVTRGMREHQREWVRQVAPSIPRFPEQASEESNPARP